MVKTMRMNILLTLKTSNMISITSIHPKQFKEQPEYTQNWLLSLEAGESGQFKGKVIKTTMLTALYTSKETALVSNPGKV